MNTKYFISLVTNPAIAQMFADKARSQGWTSSDWLRVLVKSELRKSGFREHSLIEIPQSRELSEKNVRGNCIQCEIPKEVKDAFSKYARNVQRRDMQKAARVLVFDALVSEGIDISYEQMHKNAQPEPV